MTRTGKTPDSWQKDLLRSSSDRVLVLASRQVGKSETSAALALKTALLDEALILLLSPSLRQSALLFLRVLALYRDLGRPIPTVRPRDNSLRLELANGSRIISLPGTEATIRGYANAALLVLDEAARIPDSLYLSVRPFLSISQGSLICVSSAYSRSGFFFEEFVNGGDRWQRYTIRATDCPRHSPAFLAEERAAMGDLFFEREYGCVFSESTDSVFRDCDIMGMLDGSVEPFFEGA